MWTSEQLTSGFNVWYSAQSNSPTFRKIFRDVYAEEHFEQLALFSYATASDLRRAVHALSSPRSGVVVDLGCGCGGVALWLTQEIGASVVGIDLSDIAISQATCRAREMSVQDRVDFRVGDITATEFPVGHFAGAVSIDALWLVPPEAAIKEVSRIVKPGAPFIFTTWDQDVAPPGYPNPIPDHRPLLARAGFDVDVYENPSERDSKRRKVYEGFVSHADDLEKELGKAAAGVILLDARLFLGMIDGVDYFARTRRVFAVARKA